MEEKKNQIIHKALGEKQQKQKKPRTNILSYRYMSNVAMRCPPFRVLKLSWK
jgi:hypothetical protein